MKTRQSLKVIHRQGGTRALWLLLAISLFFILPAFIWPDLETHSLGRSFAPLYWGENPSQFDLHARWPVDPGSVPSLWGHLVLIMTV